VNAGASRLLAPAIVVLLAAGIVSAAVVGGDDDDAAAPPTTTTTSTPADDPDDEDEVATPASTSTSSTTTTSTTAPGATTSAPPAGSATTATTAPGSAPPATQPTATTSAPAGPADLILHTNRFERVGRVRFSVENAGPGTAPGIVLTLTGVPGDVDPSEIGGDGVTCEGSGTVTCRVAATGTGGLIGFVELDFADGCPQVVASVASTVDDPDPASNTGSRGLC
jgi:hypothetical protein